MTFLEAVNRVLRSEGIIRGDDDALTSFTSTQFSNTLQLAQIAIQNELNKLVSDEFIAYEEADSSVTMVTGTRTYALAADFVRMQQPFPRLVKVDGSGNSLNTFIDEYPGGEAMLKFGVLDYREASGGPSYWYMTGGTAKTLGVYPLPSATTNGDIYRYYYEKTAVVSVTSDTVPFVTESEANAFVETAARRFKYLHASAILREQLFPRGLEGDPVIEEARSVLMSLLRGKAAAPAYGRRYPGG